MSKKLPEYMKTANEIHWEWHLKMQSAFQKYVDNSISKTINLANECPVEDVDKIYMTALKSGLKGITIYRDGSKTNQPLNKIEEPGEDFSSLVSESRPATTEELAPAYSALLKGSSIRKTEYRKRGPVAVGVTHKVDTGKGKIYITINYDEHQADPVEVFIRLSYTATPTEISQAEFIGRLISTLLKHDVPIKDIVRQGNKVFSDGAFWYDKRSFCSLPQIIVHLLQYTFEDALNMAEIDLYSVIDGDSVITVTEGDEVTYELNPVGEYCTNCGELTLIGEGGCKVCTNCGFEKCG